MSQPPRAPAQFSSLSDFTDELMVLSESLKRRAEGLAAREKTLDARERDLEATGARMQQGKDSYLVELEEELAAAQERLKVTEAQLARFRRERADVTQRLASTQSWLQDAESKAAQLSDQVRHHEKAAGARTDSQRQERRQYDKRVSAIGAFVQVLFDLLEGNDTKASKVCAGALAIPSAPTASLPTGQLLTLQACCCCCRAPRRANCSRQLSGRIRAFSKLPFRITAALACRPLRACPT